ncbi:MAG TPA: YdeI/OmpD-associated family protein [Chitinophagaceae bacterium]|nr:YdeI/OmpD-associated family protein [Chitinophagaceae bacterium]
MALSIAQKLRLKDGMTILPVNAPSTFTAEMGRLAPSVKVSPKGKDYAQVHWFVMNKAEMEKDLSKVLALVKNDVVCWIYYPKGTSKIQTDLTRDKGWEKLLAHTNLQWLSLISFDDTWSSFGIRLKTEDDKKAEAKPKEREIFKWVDQATKTVILPGDLAKALKKSRPATQFFESLSFTNKKEYIEWIVTAKREETRAERVTGTVERLEKSWKNPRNL